MAGLSPRDFPKITADIFQPMDGGIALAPNEIMGRNTWNLWSGGNEHFWDHVARDSFGLMDCSRRSTTASILEAIVSRPSG